MIEAPTEFIDEFNKDVAQVSMFVDVEFANNRFNYNQKCTASSEKGYFRRIDQSVKEDIAKFWSAKYAFNNKNHNTMKWLVCDSGARLQETETGSGYRCIDADNKKDDDYEYGWWSIVKSNATTGVFAVPQWVQSEFFEDDGVTPKGRHANRFVLYLDSAYDNMKKISAYYKNSTGAWVNIFTERTLGIDEYEVEYDIPSGEPVMIYGLKVIVHETRSPGDNARISEFNAFYVDRFSSSDYIETASISEVREEYSGERPVGTISANTFSLSLVNTDLVFSPSNENSTYAPYLTENNKVVPYITAGGHDMKLGEFWTDEWSEDGGSVGVNVSCRDFSKFIQEPKEKFGRVWKDKDISVPFVDLLSHVGFLAENIELKVNTSRKYPIIFVGEDSIWELFGQLALAEGVNFGINRDGKFVMKHNYSNPVFFYDDFNTDADELSGQQPTLSVNNEVWSDFLPATWHHLKAYEGSAKSDNVTWNSLASTHLDDDEIIMSAKLSVKGSQGLAMFAGKTASNAGWGFVVDRVNDALIMVEDGIIGNSTPLTYTDESEFKVKITKQLMQVYVDGDMIDSTTLASPIDAGYCGFATSAVASGTSTEVSWFKIQGEESSVMSFDGSTNIEAGSSKTELWTNEVVVKVSEYAKENQGKNRLWGPESPCILSYSRLLEGITATSTEIKVEREERQKNGLLTDNGWPKYDGIIFIPQFSGGVCIGGELIKYEERTDRTFKNCKRGYAGTKAKSWPADSYLGEAREWDIEFENTPAMTVYAPFSTSIDTMKNLLQPVQSHIVLFEHDSFYGKLIIGNIAKYLTVLEGSGLTIADYDAKNEDGEIDWTTIISGAVAKGGENKQKVVRKLDDVKVSDNDRIMTYGKNKLEIQNNWIQTRFHAQEIADTIIDEYSVPRNLLTMQAICPPVLELGDRVTITEYVNMAIEDVDYHVIEMNSQFSGDWSTEFTLRRAK